MICTAAVAAALFTPVPATAEVIERPRMGAVAAAPTAMPQIAPPDTLALSLVSTGLIGIGLSMGGLVIVAYRRRQW
ncbi:MAG TPA: hypothetical protein VF062_08575 [Candidatus Limnocylindrales bacterium]